MAPKRRQVDSPSAARGGDDDEAAFDKPSFDPAEMQRRIAAAQAARRAHVKKFAADGCCGGGGGGHSHEHASPAGKESDSEPDIIEEEEEPPKRPRKPASPPPKKEKKKNPDGTDAEDDEEDDPVPSKGHYAMIIALAVFFVSLPLGEPVIDWVQVAVFAALNAVWIGYFHRAVALHLVVFFMLNLIAVQYPVFAQHIPAVVENVNPVTAGLVVGANAIICLVFWLTHARKKPKKEQLDAWDLFLCLLLLGNALGGIATGVIPMAVVYRAFKTIVGLLTNFSVN